MKVKNSIAQQAIQTQPKKQEQTFSSLITSDVWQATIANSIKNPDRASSFTTSLISIVSSKEELKDCDQGSIIAAALQGESQRLILALGQFSVVPYNDKSGKKLARYQPTYKGILQLAMRSGEYKKIKVRDVRKGEYTGIDPLTGEPTFHWLSDEERENLPLEGFYAFYILHSGFMNDLYWSHEKILNHANRYSQPFKGKKELYEQMNAGKAKRPESGSPWFDEPLSEGHMKMCKKTLIHQLFNDGIAPLSIELQSVLRQDLYVESGQEIIFADDERVVSANTVNEENVVAEVGFVKVETVEEPNQKNTKQVTVDETSKR